MQMLPCRKLKPKPAAKMTMDNECQLNMMKIDYECKLNMMTAENYRVVEVKYDDNG